MGLLLFKLCLVFYPAEEYYLNMSNKSFQKLSFNINLDLRIVCLVLLVVIASMFAFWRPWEQNVNNARKITISGESTVKATPDEFTFDPYFEKSDSDSEKAKTELDALGKKLHDDLVKLGVKDEDITLNSSSYDKYYTDDGGTRPDAINQSVTLNIQITVASKALAQKTQDYLATTEAKGQLTSQPHFSKAKTKKLENEARQKAIVDAKDKAKQTAEELGVSVGRVITINDQSNQFIMPYGSVDKLAEGKVTSGLPVTPGQQDINYTIEVIFELR